MKLYCLLRFVFSVNFAFIKFATDLSAKRKSRFLAWNYFFLLTYCIFRKEPSGTNLIPAIVTVPRTLTIYLFSLIGTVLI